MPAEETEHERTWMCWPSNRDVWGDDLEAVQDTIAEIALTIAEFEPVTMLCRPDQLDALGARTGGAIELLAAPVDDLWARDTLPCFVTGIDQNGSVALAAARFRFNGWGGKPVHDGDSQLAGVVAQHLRIELIDSGLVGEGGGIEIDGEGTVLAARSSWVNDNRNAGLAEADIEDALTATLGAERVVRVDGLAGAEIVQPEVPRGDGADLLATIARAAPKAQPSDFSPGTLTTINSLSSASTGLRPVLGKLLSHPSNSRVPSMTWTASIDSQATPKGSPS